ncbi:hypothetical protein UCREL1_1296 [Eutypa lata UCREL1]|uniref:Uncharacterized protein n=1 Tax=Eutypa lata (strain UCR-EL1) TaxID=1287681 RepID=M7T457_EUTLA|nr:hypothetical protein UCREL1_1296 [Eutypa lata UCREL1]
MSSSSPAFSTGQPKSILKKPTQPQTSGKGVVVTPEARDITTGNRVTPSANPSFSGDLEQRRAEGRSFRGGA